MILSEIQDAVDFEVRLTKLILKRAWAHEYTSVKVASGKSDATVSGVIKITDKHLLSDDHEALTNDVRHQIAHLISGIKCGHNFNWQYIANKLLVKSDLIKLKAKEVVECVYCGEFTVFTKLKMCNTCMKVHEVITNHPKTVKLILNKLEEMK
jgi:hypothetical protein